MSSSRQLFLPAAIAASLGTACAVPLPALGQSRLSVNPYTGLGFAVPASPDLCKVGTSGVDADARDTARNIAEAPGSPSALELNNCHLHAVDDTFSTRSSTTNVCHPDHEPPDGNCGRPAAEWCDDPCATTTCGGTGCVTPQCSVVATTHEVLAPSWSYDFPLNPGNSHELDLVATRQENRLWGNCVCASYTQAACPPPPPPPGRVVEGSDNGSNNGGGSDHHGGAPDNGGGGSNGNGGDDSSGDAPGPSDMAGGDLDMDGNGVVGDDNAGQVSVGGNGGGGGSY